MFWTERKRKQFHFILLDTDARCKWQQHPHAHRWHCIHIVWIPIWDELNVNGNVERRKGLLCYCEDARCPFASLKSIKLRLEAQKNNHFDPVPSRISRFISADASCNAMHQSNIAEWGLDYWRCANHNCRRQFLRWFTGCVWADDRLERGNI